MLDGLDVVVDVVVGASVVVAFVLRVVDGFFVANLFVLVTDFAVVVTGFAVVVTAVLESPFLGS